MMLNKNESKNNVLLSINRLYLCVFLAGLMALLCLAMIGGCKKENNTEGPGTTDAADVSQSDVIVPENDRLKLDTAKAFIQKNIVLPESDEELVYRVEDKNDDEVTIIIAFTQNNESFERRIDVALDENNEITEITGGMDVFVGEVTPDSFDDPAMKEFAKWRIEEGATEGDNYEEQSDLVEFPDYTVSGNTVE